MVSLFCMRRSATAQCVVWLWCTPAYPGYAPMLTPRPENSLRYCASGGGPYSHGPAEGIRRYEEAPRTSSWMRTGRLRQSDERLRSRSVTSRYQLVTAYLGCAGLTGSTLALAGLVGTFGACSWDFSPPMMEVTSPEASTVACTPALVWMLQEPSACTET